MKKITINFDLDGTIADLYGVDGWLEMLTAEDPTPYEIAQPLVRLNSLAKRLNFLQQLGYNIAIISWLSKTGSAEYNQKVTEAKLEWLARHLPSVTWDRISIVEYGTPKENFCETPFDVLFDDEEQNRSNWNGFAFDVDNITEDLNRLKNEFWFLSVMAL